MERDIVTIKYSDLVELLKHHMGDVIFAEALKLGEIQVVDDATGQIINKIKISDKQD